MAQKDSAFQALINVQRTSILNLVVPSAPTAKVPNETEPALNVVTVYQDPLTRHWATELWERVGQLISQVGLWRQSWKISELTDPWVFTDAVSAAAAADVLVVSVRDAGEWPMGLHLWIDAWLPKRAERGGALVALIGVPGQPDAQSGRAHHYLEAVAREAGLDFLPRERKLPEVPLAFSSLAKIGDVPNTTMAGYGRTPAVAQVLKCAGGSMSERARPK